MSTRQKNGKTWRNWLGVVSLVACFQPTQLAMAELKFFPHWERKTCEGGEFACYDFAQTKLILAVDFELQYKISTLENCLLDVADLKKIELKLEAGL